jgi:hypothetical protein
MPHLIGLYSPAPQSGKTTLANALQGHGYSRESFAAPLKAMLSALLDYAGVPENIQNRMLYGDLKEEPCWALAGKSARHALQTLGTEWGRNCIDENIWVQIAMVNATSLMNYNFSVVFDDMRFPNEFRAIKEEGGTTIRIIRPGTEHDQKHSSEGSLDDHDFDLTLVNNFDNPVSWALHACAQIAKYQGAR